MADETPILSTVPSVQLSGRALTGVDVGLSPALLASLPSTVRLGRLRPLALSPTLKIGSYLSPSATPPPAVSPNRRDKAAASLARMYLNDTYGICVISGKAHALGVWSANDSDSGGVVLATDKECYDQYQSVCGRGDNGCYIPDVLDYMVGKGFLAGGKTYKLDGYCAVDWTNKLEVQIVQIIFGATCIGINLPAAWVNDDVWDVTNSQIVGGHDVTPIDYDEKGVYVSSWGRVYLITWAAFLSKKWLEEMYVMLAPLWYGSDKIAPSGLDADTLKADLAKLASGVLPDIGPTPLPPPGPGPGPVPTGSGILLESDMKAGFYPVGGTTDVAGVLQGVNQILVSTGQTPIPMAAFGGKWVQVLLLVATFLQAPSAASALVLVNAILALFGKPPLASLGAAHHGVAE